MFEQQGVDRHFLYAHINSPAMLIPWESGVFSPLKVNYYWACKILIFHNTLLVISRLDKNWQRNHFTKDYFVFFSLQKCPPLWHSAMLWFCIQPDSLALTVAHLFSRVPYLWLPNTREPLTISSLISRVAFHWRFFWQRLCKYFRLRKLNRLSLKLGPWLR